MRILLDVDGPLADFVGAALAVVNELGATKYARSEVRDWDMDKLLPQRLRQAFWERVTSAGFCAALRPVDGAVEVVADLRSKHEVFFVTSDMATCPTWAHERRGWLKEHFGVHFKSVVHTHAKYLVRGDVLVDDKPSHCEEWQEANPEGLAILWSMPHNRTMDERFSSVSTWPEASSFLASLNLRVA